MSNLSAKAPLPMAHPEKRENESRSSGLPAHFSAFPAQVQWRAGKSGISSAYGGGSAPDLNGIPYEAPRGASVV